MNLLFLIPVFDSWSSTFNIFPNYIFLSVKKAIYSQLIAIAIAIKCKIFKTFGLI